MDDPKIQVRSIDESWMENIAAVVSIEYAGNRGDNFIETKSLAFLKVSDTFATSVVIFIILKKWKH